MRYILKILFGYGWYLIYHKKDLTVKSSNLIVQIICSSPPMDYLVPSGVQAWWSSTYTIIPSGGCEEHMFCLCCLYLFFSFATWRSMLGSLFPWTGRTVASIRLTPAPHVGLGCTWMCLKCVHKVPMGNDICLIVYSPHTHVSECLCWVLCIGYGYSYQDRTTLNWQNSTNLMVIIFTSFHHKSSSLTSSKMIHSIEAVTFIGKDSRTLPFP